MKKVDTSLWEKRLYDELQEREKMRRKFLAAAVLKLKNYFKRKKHGSVYLAGSILERGKFYDFSDVDVALEIFPKNPFRMTAELERNLGRPIDLIALKECRFRGSLLKCARKIL